jgi:hypothetical protein
MSYRRYNRTINTNNTITNTSININPSIWGPLIWNLLYEFAKHAHKLSEFAEDYKNVIKCLPHILPCTKCRNHCIQAYNERINAINVNNNDFPEWIWKMKSIVNTNTNAVNLNLENYIHRLNVWSIFITESSLWDLLFMLSYSYPRYDDHDSIRQSYYIIFFKSVSRICEQISHLNKFKVLREIKKLDANSKWSTNSDLQSWLIDLYQNMYNKTPDIYKYKI